MKFRTLLLGAAAAALAAACTSTEAATETALAAPAEKPAATETTVMVGGAAMYPSKNIVENAVNSADHTTLVAAVTAAGLVETLSSPGPFTVFAPVNDAFAALPAGTVDTLLLPENKETLTKVLTAHVVAGDLKAADLIAAAEANGGTATLTTVSGDTLTFAIEGGAAVVTDESGGKGTVTIADVDQSNGVIHVVDRVLLPN
ncbi:MAG: fasciclin domain-containing protein [Hyphomonas sp.]|nr:fasciclin domain-containing protein [Hyphomonas sp.]